MQIYIPSDFEKGYKEEVRVAPWRSTNSPPPTPHPPPLTPHTCPQVPLGTVEINNFMTLYDLRVVMKFELDKKVRVGRFRRAPVGVCAPRVCLSSLDLLPLGRACR